MKELVVMICFCLLVIGVVFSVCSYLKSNHIFKEGDYVVVTLTDEIGQVVKVEPRKAVAVRLKNGYKIEWFYEYELRLYEETRSSECYLS